jgi:phosphoenolpyruvate carboxykinase (GTP)
MAMLPFCGYNMGLYFRHWINMGRLMTRPPRIYAMNAFRVDEGGRFLWPGFGENIRILKWIIDRVNGKAGAKETPLGLVPDWNTFSVDGAGLTQSRLQRLFEVRPGEWQDELQDIKEFLDRFGAHLPYEIRNEFNRMSARLQGSRGI